MKPSVDDKFIVIPREFLNLQARIRTTKSIVVLKNDFNVELS